MLSPAETKALYPLMNVDDLYGTLYVPHDGTMDPAGTCTTLARAATARGAQVPVATGLGALLPAHPSCYGPGSRRQGADAILTAAAVGLGRRDLSPCGRSCAGSDAASAGVPPTPRVPAPRGQCLPTVFLWLLPSFVGGAAARVILRPHDRRKHLLVK